MKRKIELTETDNISNNQIINKKSKHIQEYTCYKRKIDDTFEINNSNKKNNFTLDIRCIFCFSKINNNDNCICGHPYHDICLYNFLNRFNNYTNNINDIECIFCNFTNLYIKIEETEKIAIHLKNYIDKFNINTDNSAWNKIYNFIKHTEHINNCLE